jgi:putative heme iron utilization protein
MQIQLSPALHLLHRASSGVLATQSLQLEGYPFATVLPFALDEHHRPIFLISGLAEHTKNLLADQRASLLVSEPGSQSVLKGARLTIIGDVQPLKASNDLVTRYLRYQPEGKEYLELGDFSFFQLMPLRIRYIAGFAEMGWLEEATWKEAATLSLNEEKTIYFEVAPTLPSGIRLLGIDAYGFDIEHGEQRDRHQFADAPVQCGNLAEVIKRFLQSL